MATIAEWKAMQRADYLQLHSEGLLTAIELFPCLLDTFSEEGVVEELEAARGQIGESVREFLAGHRPTTFRALIIGSAPEEPKVAQERRRKYAALLLALGVNAPGAEKDI